MPIKKQIDPITRYIIDRNLFFEPKKLEVDRTNDLVEPN
jgi:hypothetical protein